MVRIATQYFRTLFNSGICESRLKGLGRYEPRNSAQLNISRTIPVKSLADPPPAFDLIAEPYTHISTQTQKDEGKNDTMNPIIYEFVFK